MNFTRRMLIAASMATALAGSASIAMAQEKIELNFSAVFSQQDIRAEMMAKFAEAIGDKFAFTGYYGATLFKQGTELVALQRGNLDMGNIAPQDIANQLPQWSALTSAYLFRDSDHLRAFFNSEVGKEMTKMVEDQLSVKVLGPTYFGTRQLGLNLDKEIKTPADMEGVKLRMPGGEAWQFLGGALGANPVPMAYPEVYTGLQTGAIDGQDNPLPNVQNMKFYEVMKQVVLTSHLVGYDLLSISLGTWNKLSPEQQAKVQSAADTAIAWSTEQHLKRESELAAFMEEQGLKVYKPDVDAFRAFAQDKYLKSDLAKDWPEGIVDKVNAIK